MAGRGQEGKKMQRIMTPSSPTVHCLVLKVWQITLKSFSQEQSKSPSYQFYGESSELGSSVHQILTFCFLGRGGRHAGELDQPEAGVPGDDAGPRR